MAAPPSPGPVRRYAALAAAIFLLHATTLLLAPAFLLGSDLCVTAAAGLAVAAVWQRGLATSPAIRPRWKLFALGLLFWFTGQVGMSVYGRHQGAPQPYALGFQFALFFFGVPVLLAITSARGQVQSRTQCALNGLQLLVAAFLVFLQIHPESVTDSNASALSPLLMMYAYNTEHLVLSAAASVRLFTRPLGEEKTFYRVIFVFVALYTALTLGLNYAGYILRVPHGTFLDPLRDIPFLALAPLSFFLADAPEPHTRPAIGRLAQFFRASTPMFITISLLMLGGFVARAHFALGMSCIALATLSYGVNSSLLQARCHASEQDLLASRQSLLEAYARLERLSVLDGLTGVTNRRGFDQALHREWSLACRTDAPLSILMIDIDHFKELNDSFGHGHGDLCLKIVAAKLAGCLRRASDMLARYGGEEFVALLPGVDMAGAQVLAEQMLRSIAEAEIIHPSGERTTAVTVSIGLASYPPSLVATANNLVTLADDALYQAKASGRNRLRVSKLLVPISAA